MEQVHLTRKPSLGTHGRWLQVRGHLSQVLKNKFRHWPDKGEVWTLFSLVEQPQERHRDLGEGALLWESWALCQELSMTGEAGEAGSGLPASCQGLAFL